MFKFTKKEMRMYIEHRIDSITSPVAYQYGFETKESAYAELLELHTLSCNFGLGMEDKLEAAMKPYQEFFREQYLHSKKIR